MLSFIRVVFIISFHFIRFHYFIYNKVYLAFAEFASYSYRQFALYVARSVNKMTYK